MNLPRIQSKETSGLPRMPQLDGLRAFAVAAVLIHHYIPKGWGLGADFGVKLFFVLSGFLITSILIRARNKSEVNGKGHFTALRIFYIRRFLRIFPLYYAVVLGAALFNLDYVREFLPYLLTYTLNLKMASQGWFIDHLAHFWTLAIEEQFYLLWPWIVLLMPKRTLLPALLVLTVLGPVYRIYLIVGWTFFNLETNALASYIFTLTAFDTLGAGSLLALVLHTNLHSRIIAFTLSNVLLPAGLFILIVLQFLKYFEFAWMADLLFRDIGSACIFCWLIHQASQGFEGLTGKILTFRPITYVGKISYGIYVYHPLVPVVLSYSAGLMGLAFEQYTIFGFVASTITTLLISSVSWQFFERPINDLKRYFRN